MRFEADNQQQIDDFDHAIGMRHGEGAPGWGMGQKLWMLHRESSAIRQMNVKWLKRLCQV